MITNEPSTQQTPLPSEPGGDQEQLVEMPPQPVSQTASNEPWIAFLIGIFTWFGSVLLLIFVPAILAMPYAIYRWRTSGLPNIEAITTDKAFIFLSIVAILPSHLLTLGLVWFVVTRAGRYPFWKTVGFEWPRNINPAVGTVTCVAVAVTLLIIGFAVTYFWGGNKTQLDVLIESSIAARFATAFVAVFTAPLVEEVVYRGVLYSGLERALGTINRTIGTAVAFAVVSLLFAGVHVFQYIDNVSVITVITLLSFSLTAVRAYTGKVLPSFIIHLVFNGIQSIIIVLSPFIRWSGSS
ncbi:MAG TPA: CPBP family intramembrane glutamic endopeptidase [Pyrinomonadaceae bacterium]|nr:CPBP family intramembrane glutamic endopeptidase [Pyrinomonadaceae bacterium]